MLYSDILSNSKLVSPIVLKKLAERSERARTEVSIKVGSSFLEINGARLAKKFEQDIKVLVNLSDSLKI